MRTRPLLIATALSAFLVLGAAPAMAAPTTDRASLSTANVQGNGASLGSSISKDGKFVAFESQASNLIANDLNGAQDIFVRNRPAGKTSRVSRRSNGGEANDSSFGPHLSGSGRFVAFTSAATNLVGLDGNSASDVFVHDSVSKKTKRVSTRSNGAEANGASVLYGISADGRYVVFYSFASNLVAGDSNGVIDVFVKDRKSGKTKRVSRRTNGAQGNGNSYYSAISPNGRYIAFVSDATNLVPNDSNGTSDVFVHDRKSKKTVRASIASNGTNAAWDVFLHNIGTRKTRRVSVSSAGIQSNGNSSVTFGPPRLSADGKRIAFDSVATNLVAGDTNGAQDAFLHNRANQTTRRASVRFDGTQADNQSFVTDISSGGRFVTFLSNATNLVGGDTNGQYDVFVRGPFN
jgi:hypothetical protein